MMTKALTAFFFFVAMSVCFPVFGEEPILKPKTEGGITFISGGVGMRETDYLRKVEVDYNLRLLFAAKETGEFFADVKVRIADKKGKTVLDAVSNGPRFLAKLPAGVYQVTAEMFGEPLTRKVKISGKRAVSENFYWKATYKHKPVE